MDCAKGSAGAVAGFPEDPLVEILSRVPAKSVCRFRCVSKAWRDLIDDPLNRRKLPQTLEGSFVVDEPMRRVDGDVGRLDFINFFARSVPLGIDGCFSFLTKLLPEIEALVYGDSCNGLLLLEHSWKGQSVDTLGGYIVCNPATKHWATVPTCGCCQPSAPDSFGNSFLAFDPAISSHFHLIQYWKPFLEPRTSVHVYSSETGLWSHDQTDLDAQGQLEGHQHHGASEVSPQRAFVNGILHLIVLDMGQPQMVAVDVVQGKAKRVITMPAVAEGRCWYPVPYIGQSQGRLHYINNDFEARNFTREWSYKLSIWVLQDYDAQEWVLKDTVSFLKLFGIATAVRRDFQIVAIHPDCNVVFFREPMNRLIAYDMDRKEVSVVACLKIEDWYTDIDPYIPCFSESPALADKH